MSNYLTFVFVTLCVLHTALALRDFHDNVPSAASVQRRPVMVASPASALPTTVVQSLQAQPVNHPADESVLAPLSTSLPVSRLASDLHTTFAVGSTPSGLASGLFELVHALPRIAYVFGSSPGNYLNLRKGMAPDQKATDDSSKATDNAMEYGEGTVIIPFGIPILFSFFTVLFWLSFCIGRCCCNCCGGRQPNTKCCCACGYKDPEKFGAKYDRKTVWTYRILMGVFVAGLAAGVALGIASNSGVSAGVDASFGAFDSLVDYAFRYHAKASEGVSLGEEATNEVVTLQHKFTDSIPDRNDTDALHSCLGATLKLMDAQWEVARQQFAMKELLKMAKYSQAGIGLKGVEPLVPAGGKSMSAAYAQVQGYDATRMDMYFLKQALTDMPNARAVAIANKTTASPALSTVRTGLLGLSATQLGSDLGRFEYGYENMPLLGDVNADCKTTRPMMKADEMRWRLGIVQNILQNWQTPRTLSQLSTDIQTFVTARASALTSLPQAIAALEPFAQAVHQLSAAQRSLNAIARFNTLVEKNKMTDVGGYLTTAQTFFTNEDWTSMPAIPWNQELADAVMYHMLMGAKAPQDIRDKFQGDITTIPGLYDMTAAHDQKLDQTLCMPRVFNRFSVLNSTVLSLPDEAKEFMDLADQWISGVAMLPDFHRSLNATMLALQQLNASLAALPLGLTIPQLGQLMLQLNFTQFMPKSGETSAVPLATYTNIGTKWTALPLSPANDPQLTLLTNMKNNMIDVTVLDAFMSALQSAYTQLQAMPSPNGLDSHCSTLHGQVETLRTQLNNAQTELNQRPTDWESSGFLDSTKTPLLNAIQAVEDTMKARPASNFTSAILTQLGSTVAQLDDPATWMSSWSNLETQCEDATDFAALLTSVTTVTDAMQAEPLFDATLGTEAHPLMKALADTQTLLLTPVGTGTVLTKMDTLFATIQTNANHANSTLEDSSIKLGMLALGAKQANIANNLLIDVNMFNQQLPDIDGMVNTVRTKFQDVRDMQEQMVESRNDYNYNRNVYKLQADEYDGHRVLLFDIIFLVPLLFAVFGGIGCLFGKGCPVMWMALSFFPFMALFFLFSAVLMVPSVVTSDFCLSFEQMGHANLANIVVLKNNSFDFVQMDGDVTATSVFDYYFLGHADAEPILRKNLVPTDVMAKQNLNLSVKVDEIQQSIKDTGLKLFDGLDSDFALMHSFVNRFDNLVDGVYELSATQEFYPAFAHLKSSFCDKGFASMATAACIYFFMGLCLCPGVVLGIRGYKRLDKRNWTDTKPEDLQQPMEENEDDEVVELEGGKPEKYDNPLHQIDAKAAPKEDAAVPAKPNAKSSMSKSPKNKTVHIVDPMEMKIPASNAGEMVVNTSPSIEMQSMGSLSSSPSDASLPIVAPVSISVSVSSSASAAPVKRKPVLRASIASKQASLSQPGLEAPEHSPASQTPVRYSIKLHSPESASPSPPQNNDNPPDYTIKDLPPASSLELAQMGAVAFDENGNPLSVQP